MTPLENLFVIRRLLDNPAAWTKHAMARNCEGRKVSITHPHACAFSLSGAFHRVHHITASPGLAPARASLLRVLARRGQSLSLDSFNDAVSTTHGIVLNLIDQTILIHGGSPPERPVP